MYKFLVTNDDGIDSSGLRQLVVALSELGVVYVVAPAEEQSAVGMGITFRRPVTAEEVEMDGAEIAYRLSGTPVDCIKWGIDRFGAFAGFDFVISGINRGYNLGSGTYYSGTVGAAREGALEGIRSIALSVEGMNTENYEYTCSVLGEILSMSEMLDTSTLLNVNAPDLPPWKVKGVRVVDPAAHKYGDCYHFTELEPGVYQMEPSYTDTNDEKNDYNLIASGYMTISPIEVLLNNRNAIERLNGYDFKEPICVFMNVQEKFADEIKHRDEWEEKITRWAKCVNRVDHPALFVEQLGGGKIIDNVRILVDRVETVENSSFNALENKTFRKYVNSSRIRKVYLAGIDTDISIEQTALALLAYGMEVVVIEDCCAAKKGKAHKHAIENMRDAGCTITNYAAAIMEIIGDVSHPAYKSIQSIIAGKK